MRYTRSVKIGYISLEPLFKKVACFTDIHFGRSNNNPIAIQDNIDFLDWFIETAKENTCDEVIFLGDFFDQRHSLNIDTMNKASACFDKLSKSFKKIYMILGNHDAYLRSSIFVNSVHPLVKSYSNISLFNRPTTVGDVTFLPWLVGDQHKKLKDLKSRYVFSHLELPSFMMNAMVEMPDHGHGPKAEDFGNQEWVFSGHFHKRQSRKNICYMGNTMPFSFSDNWDEDRGMMILEWGRDPTFIAWPDQPLYRTLKLSQLLDNPRRHLKPNMTCRVSIDIDISYEESQLIKDTFIGDHRLRKMEFVPIQQKASDAEFVGEILFQSVDQIVVDGLLSVQSKDLNPATLIEIYKSL